MIQYEVIEDQQRLYVAQFSASWFPFRELWYSARANSTSRSKSVSIC